MQPNKNNNLVSKPNHVKSDGIDALKKEHPELVVIDETRRNLEELFLLRNPKHRFDKNYHNEFELFFSDFSKESFGNWFYFAWSNSLVRYLREDLHLELRTGRNKYLITKDEQEKFYNSTIAFLGMSVGSHIAIVTAMTGGAKRMKLADPDTFSGDNLNRVRMGFQNVGASKALAVARQIYEINPYATLNVFTDGASAENVERILEGSELIVEEMDDPYWKLKIRELARKRGIPVLMATDNGDGIIVDIERFDLNKNLSILNGLARGISAEKLKTMPPKDLPRVAAKIAGANLVVPRMLQSVAEVGKSLYSWPQLGTAANMCGSVIAMLARRIINKNDNIKSGRYSFNPDAVFESDYKLKWFSRKAALVRFIYKMTRGKK